jgi:hypothetical protein
VFFFFFSFVSITQNAPKIPLLQLSPPEGSGFFEQHFSYSPGSPSPPLSGFYIPSRSPAESRPSSPPLPWAACVPLPHPPCSLLSRSQRNHGRINLSSYFTPKECPASVVHGIIRESSVKICSFIFFTDCLSHWHGSPSHLPAFTPLSMFPRLYPTANQLKPFQAPTLTIGRMYGHLHLFFQSTQKKNHPMHST